jgi:fermentation-respiration switch protein FrsA (DUF1100 family)
MLAVLDRPEVSRVLFHPRGDYGLIARSGVQRVSFDVEPDVAVGGRLYPATPRAPAILYFHGNGEIAADYDALAPLYVGLGITLLVADYRGYGASGGTPTAGHLLVDAVKTYEALDGIFREHALDPTRLYVMGRSLGSAAALEVAVHAEEALAGLIIESGFADTFALLARLGVRIIGADDARDGFGNLEKINQVTLPTLILHGEEDVLIPPIDGQTLYKHSAAEEKELVLIPYAGHNDIMLVGRERYFQSVREFVSRAHDLVKHA